MAVKKSNIFIGCIGNLKSKLHVVVKKYHSSVLINPLHME